MFSNFLIGLREGLEASLVVCILIAYLVKTGNRDKLLPIWIGVAIAVVVSLAFGAGLEFGSQEMTFKAQEALGGSLSIVSVGLVTWMVFWMRRTARHLKAELHGKLDAALAMGTGALVATALLAVGREGLETSLFVWRAVHAADDGWHPMIGAVLGIATAVVLGWLFYRGALKINLAKFFTWTGGMLVVVAAGVLAYGVHDLRGGGVPRRPAEPGVRHQLHHPAGQLVRHPPQGHVQLPAGPHRPPTHRLGAVSGPDPRAVPVPGRVRTVSGGGSEGAESNG